MATIVYLDADDEITSAASRIRHAADSRVAVVIPFGSRVATSRINFKLLAREAMANGRRLDIVTPDASARALAASAGLPVFASVAEYEDALEAPPAGDDAPTRPVPDARTAGVAATAVAAGAGATGAAGARSGGFAGATAAGRAPTTSGDAEAAREQAAREAELDEIVHRGREVPIARPRRRGPSARLLAGLLVLLAGLVAAGAAAVVFLPSATITVTPRVEVVGPVELVISADPAATAVDEAALVIPAQVVDVPVEVSGEFEATGRRVETTPATGAVRWRNCDPSASYTIPGGTVVRTPGGVDFAIDEAVFLPVAQIEGSGAVQTIRCRTSDVAVTAVKEGPDGNVDAGQIRIVPARYDRNLVTVNNQAATTGGTREEFTRIARRDIDAALASLAGELGAEFEMRLEDPDGVPAGATAFAETATLGEPAPMLDPETLVNQEVATFVLGMTATGRVLAVDPSPVEAIAAEALREALTPGYELVEGSTRVAVGEGAVRGGVVEFRVAGVAKQVRPVDGEALRLQVMGLAADEARAALEPYGVVEIVLWPDLVTTVPTIDQRVTLTVLEPVDETPEVTPVPSTPEPTEPGAGSPDGGVPSEPVPSA